jgi:hypothetical protein
MRQNPVPAAVSALIWTVLAAPGPVSAQGPPAYQPRAIRVDICARAVEARIRQDHPHTDRVEVDGRTVSEWSWSRTEVAVSGEGKMLRGSSWNEFDFVCLIDARSNGVTLLEWSGPLKDGEPVRPGAQPPSRLLGTLDDGSIAGRECRAALEAAIRSDHPRSGRLELDRSTLRRWRRSPVETGVRGEGEFAGSRGLPHPIEFGCVWDERRGQVASVYYELR